MPSVVPAPILVVAALSYELQMLQRAAHAELALLETGEGVENAKREVESWLGKRAARAVLSIGFAGALSAPLQIGDLVIAERVHGSDANPDANLLAASKQIDIGFPVRVGSAVTAHQILWQAASKRALASSLGTNEIAFVDMESTAIADVCAGRGLPFLIIRSISDLLDEDLPLDFNQYRNHEGRVVPGKVLNAALLRPAAFRGLLELRKRSRLCAGRMAEFVERLVPLIDGS
jgi:adenosylhomocysteine nucleosidase